MTLRVTFMAALVAGIGGVSAFAADTSGFGTDTAAEAKGSTGAAPAEAAGTTGVTGMPKMDDKIPDEKALLEMGLKNMARLRGFHIEASIDTPAGPASLSGDLGDGTLSIKGTDPKGNQKLRVVVAGEFYLSTDGGKTWKTGADAEKDYTILFSNLLTAPIDPSLEPWKQGEFKSIEETIDGEELLHIVKPAAGKDAAADYWLCKEPDLEKSLDGPPVFLRKVHIIVAADDGDFPITVTYSNLTKPVEIKAPVVAKP